MLIYLLSAIFHGGCCQSEATRDYLLQLDYVGVAIAIFGNSVAPFYYGMMCDRNNFYFYSGIVLLSSCLAAFVSTTRCMLKTSKNWISVLVYTFSALTTVPGIFWMVFSPQNKKMW